MKEEYVPIGTDAGRVWRYLKDNGKASPTQLVRALKTTSASVHRAIGWLAREGKVKIAWERGMERISLSEQA
jgi:hypothetical protein